ncbi:MAG TPA: 16S rRNA (adenine(1518)-N(6)/adenine(1519)-N(6))-dimethyltransferase RsmA [Vicinamibacterales bacterium]|nr:16S rRNA (adenine(1518)-N(6)/adenine(1519)-N(6))-dimethyltransferase RsmA [Vicinamibacterales bacterium]
MRGRRAAGIRDSGSGIRSFPRARKRFGQHFLEPAWVARLIAAVAPNSNETFIEIGPGRGALTTPLAERAGKVIAVELDRDLAATLAPRVPQNVRLVQANFLDVDLPQLLQSEQPPVRVVGNLPYNVASPILFRLLDTADEGRLLRDATLMVQREVADRIVAAPGGGDYGAMSIQVQLVADVERVLSLPPGAFRPPPRVHSAVVQLRFRLPRVDVGSREVFERVVRGLFLQRRKTLANALKPVAASFGHSSLDVLQKAGLDGGRRPETLALEDIARLSQAVL